MPADDLVTPVTRAYAATTLTKFAPNNPYPHGQSADDIFIRYWTKPPGLHFPNNEHNVIQIMV